MCGRIDQLIRKTINFHECEAIGIKSFCKKSGTANTVTFQVGNDLFV